MTKIISYPFVLEFNILKKTTSVKVVALSVTGPTTIRLLRTYTSSMSRNRLKFVYLFLFFVFGRWCLLLKPFNRVGTLVDTTLVLGRST